MLFNAFYGLRSGQKGWLAKWKATISELDRSRPDLEESRVACLIHGLYVSGMGPRDIRARTVRYLFIYSFNCTWATAQERRSKNNWKATWGIVNDGRQWTYQTTCRNHTSKRAVNYQEKCCSCVRFCTKNNYLPLSTACIWGRDNAKSTEEKIYHIIHPLRFMIKTFRFMRNVSVRGLKISIRLGGWR